jgi:sec-independent protein translocase protein TatA
MGIGLSELLVILVIVFVLFGAGKLPKVMGDLGKGLRSFRDGIKEDKAEASEKDKA